MVTFVEILWIIASYLVGSILPSYIFVRVIKGADIRTLGDGNPGSYNAGKILGKKWGVITGTIDIGKGFIMPLMPFILKMPHALTTSAISGIAVVFGHAFPVYFGFKGGMAIAPTIGALSVLAYREMIWVLPIWLGLFLILYFTGHKDKRGLAEFIAFLLLIPLEFVYRERTITLIASAIILFHLYLRRFILKKTIY